MKGVSDSYVGFSINSSIHLRKKMKMLKVLTYCSLLAMLMLTISCTRDVETPKFDPAINIDLESLNTQIELSDSEVHNSFKNGETLSIVITNVSDKPVIFTEDFGVKIFTPMEENWIEVENNYTYRVNPGTLPPNKDVPISFVVKTRPFLHDLITPQRIRVLVVGYLENNKTHPVGAFIDITLYP